MSWNYRVCKRTFKNTQSFEEQYEIHEVYYDDENGKMNGWTNDAISPSGESLKELKEELLRMLEALDKEVIEINE